MSEADSDAGPTAGLDEITVARRGDLVVVTLNRPKALNALTKDMCRVLDRGLRAWAIDPEVGAVLIKGAGERAFCAGGDIRAIHGALSAGQGLSEVCSFYAVEYPMNTRLHHFPKPYIALLDGVTMGGGVGVSIHGSHRIVTERTLFAMPETGIGLFPDVGATYVLPRLPGALGHYLGLTGARLGAADCLDAGIGTGYVPAERLDALESALAEAPLCADPAAVEGVLTRFEADPGPAGLADLRERIDACYAQPGLGAVLAALEAEPSGWGGAQLQELATKAPLSLAVTFRQLCSGATLDFESAMRLEYRLVHRFMAGHDFREGVRALLVDKDRRPTWQPARLSDVSEAMVDRYFAPLPDGDLVIEP